jgi:tetratricopeptide (TPR) repeat protein
MALADEDFAAVEKWTVSGIHIDVLDADLHAWRAQSARKRHEPKLAIDELTAAIEIEPKKSAPRFALAEAYRDADRRDKARETLEELLGRDPEYPGAKALLESLR